MKQFKHPQYPQATLARSTLPSNVRLYKYAKEHIGETFDIVEVVPCSYTQESVPCKDNPNCPGLIRLDRPPFNHSCDCYSWMGRSIFDFEGDK